MSVARTKHRQTSDSDHPDKTHTDKNKHLSDHTGTKNATFIKTEIRGQKNAVQKADSVEHTSVHKKLDTKRQASVDTHTKTTHAVASTHANETTKSHGATGVHGSHSHTKGQTHADPQGKTVAHGRSDTHGKTGTHGTAKKSDGNKSRINKQNKVEHGKDDNEETNDVGTPTVFLNSENISNEKHNDDDSN